MNKSVLWFDIAMNQDRSMKQGRSLRQTCNPLEDLESGSRKLRVTRREPLLHILQVALKIGVCHWEGNDIELSAIQEIVHEADYM
jgi:hypothetical protein